MPSEADVDPLFQLCVPDANANNIAEALDFTPVESECASVRRCSVRVTGVSLTADP